MLLNCKTDHATLLLAVKDEKGVLRFPPSDDSGLPGIHFAVRPLVPIHDQITAAATACLGRDTTRKLAVTQEYADELPRPDGQLSTLYLAMLEDESVPAPSTWPSLPELLRKLPKNRTRLPYLRAWQILTGALTQDTRALDVEDVVKHLQKD